MADAISRSTPSGWLQETGLGVIRATPTGFINEIPAAVLTKKYQIPTNAADGTTRKLFVWADTTLASALVANVSVVAAGGFFKHSDASLVVGVTRPAALLAWGADATVAAFSGSCWATGIEE